MNKTFSLWLVICLCSGLTLWGCGGDGGGDGGSGGAGGNGNGNSAGGGSGNNNSGGGSGASCASVCGVLTACPSAGLDPATCMTVCEQTMSGGCRDCIANSSTCGDDCPAACSGGGMGGGGTGGSGMGGGGMGGGGNNQQGAPIGQECSFNSDCDGGFCIGGGLQDGYCSKTCTDFTDCPEFWDCADNPDGPGQVCLNNG